MEYKIITPEALVSFNELFEGKNKSNSHFNIDQLIKNQIRYSKFKRKLPLDVLVSLEFIEILIEFYSPRGNQIFSSEQNIRFSYGEIIHLDLITNVEIFDEYKKFVGIQTPKHVKQYFDEIYSLIQFNYPKIATSEKYTSFNHIFEKYEGFKHQFEKYVDVVLGLKDILIEKEASTPIDQDLHSIIELLTIKIDPIFKNLSKDLDSFVLGIDPITLSWLAENKTFPPFWDENKMLRMKDDRKADIVRFADFFGLTISQVNKIFIPKVDSNDRNKVSKEGIYRILNKYSTLKKNIST